MNTTTSTHPIFLQMEGVQQYLHGTFYSLPPAHAVLEKGRWDISEGLLVPPSPRTLESSDLMPYIPKL